MADDRVALIKEANDIVEVIGSYVPSLRPAGSAYKGLCPFHDDRRPSFHVDPRWQNFRCWACGKSGDVISFVQEFERVDFREALELLARRAGITLEKNADSPQNRGRGRMLEVMAWAADQFHRCLLESPLAEAARTYVGERNLSGETVERYGLGYAPLSGEWLVQRAARARMDEELLETVGLLARRTEGTGYYDRFRDRLMFPIRDAVRGQAVGFGGRILPSSLLSARAPKYYNSCGTPLFSKSENLYGLEVAKQAADAAGYLAVVEGYTDVLMAHQAGVLPVVATLGTGLNDRHVRQLRRYTPKVVLVFDADAGGNTGVDRALEIFVGQEVDLAIATLPAGLDPCDLLVRQGPEAFRQVLANAVDALDFKLNHALAPETANGIEGRRRAVETVLRLIALVPEMPGHAGAVKRELIVNRIAQRCALKEETVWARLKELRAERRSADKPAPPAEPNPADRTAKADEAERQLLQVLLAEPGLVPAAAAEVTPEDIAHPGLKQLLSGLYALQAAGIEPDLDRLRPRIDNPYLAGYALKMQEQGRQTADRAACLRSLLAEFRRRRREPEKQEIQNQLHATADHATAVELLKQLQNQPR